MSDLIVHERGRPDVLGRRKGFISFIISNFKSVNKVWLLS